MMLVEKSFLAPRIGGRGPDRLKCSVYFPMQKSRKITSRISSTSTLPVSRPSARAARRSSSAISSSWPAATDSPPHALLLDRVLAVAHAGGIQQRDRIPAQIEMHLDHVARGAGVRRHDRGLASRQPIEQARLAGIWRPGDGDREPLTQPLAAMRVAQRLLNLVKQFPRSMKRRAGQVLRHVGLGGKIDPRLDQRERADQPL